MKAITYQGITFTTYQQAADFIGISKVGFSKRFQKYKAGIYSLDNLFKSCHPNKKEISYHGKKFNSYVEAAKYIGSTPETFGRRHKQYENGEISLDKLFRRTKYTPYELPAYHGRKFTIKKEAASFLKISQTALTRRLKYYHSGKYDLDDLFSKTPNEIRNRHAKKTPLQFADQKFDTYQQAADYVGISQPAFSNRMKKYYLGSYALNQVFEAPKHTHGNVIKYKNHTFYTYKAASEFIGISYNSFSKRLKKYKSDAITLDELFAKPDVFRTNQNKFG
ncbi:hypothetical protein OQI89_06860 [Lentilactobacillus diolivorans]|uniref:hypothetical protein n=1 Tax=Lentilactobacillus diolivorans TaxID=179838 RepID=UPI002468F4A4|nr:hypothetical protein [Lentilactobacillus diolivorans]MDH5105569.1 hypothetical protein [Lentilactobacillus diolivorans]